MTHPVQKYLHDSGYAPGDALTIGPALDATQRLWLGIVAATVACIGALMDSYGTLVSGLVGAVVLIPAHSDAAKRPALRLEKEGIWRGDSLIAWSHVRACHRAITGKQAFIEFTFTNADGREQTQRSLAATALYRQLMADTEPKPEADEEDVARAEQATYRSAPPVMAPLVLAPKERRTSWWRALVRLVWGRR